MEILSQREAQIYSIYRVHILANQPIPTMKRIAADLNISYTAVNTYTRRIIEKGYLIRESQRVLKLVNLE